MLYQKKKLLLTALLAIFTPAISAVSDSIEHQVERVKKVIEDKLKQNINLEPYFFDALRERDFDNIVLYFTDTYWFLKHCLGLVEGISDDVVEQAVEQMRQKYAYDLILNSDYSVDELVQLHEVTISRKLNNQNREPARQKLLEKIEEARCKAPTSLVGRYVQKCRNWYRDYEFVSWVYVRTKVNDICNYFSDACICKKLALVALLQRYRG